MRAVGSSGGARVRPRRHDVEHAASNVSNNDTVGSKVLPMRGTLTGGVDTAGPAHPPLQGQERRLAEGGPLQALAPGRDGEGGLHPAPAQQAAADGLGQGVHRSRTITVALTAGQWMFYSSPGKKTFFIVHA